MWLSEIQRISKLYTNKINSVYTGIYPRNLVYVFKMLLKGCPIFMNENFTSLFIKHSLERNHFRLVSYIMDIYGLHTYNKSINMLKDKFDETTFKNYNLLSRTVFITEDLDSIINKLKESVDENVNKGPQSWRGQSDSLSYAIYALDYDFRKSMNCHN